MAEGQGLSIFQADLERYRQVQIIEEEITEEMRSAICENCVKGGPPELLRRFEPESRFVECVAVFLCFDCEMYVCENCLPGHESHKGVRVGRNEREGEGRETSESERMEEESERELSFMLDDVMRESETERIEKFERSHVSIYDRVYVKHELDQEDCWITGLCVLENQRWVACDCSNSCIKIFTLGNNVLQRYIRFVGSEPRSQDSTAVRFEESESRPHIIAAVRFEESESRPQVITAVRFEGSDPRPQVITELQFKGSAHRPQFSTAVRYRGYGPYNVSEILVNQNFTEPNFASGSNSGVSVTDRAEQNIQCLIAVTLPWKPQIMLIDLSKKPAFIHKVICTREECWSIQFHEGKIFTACVDGRRDSPWSVYIYSIDGHTLNKFNTDFYSYFPGPYLAVASGRVYLTDWSNNKVQRRNVEGQVLSEITIERSGPAGIYVDPDSKVYVCDHGHGKVYKLDADLTRYETVLDQTADYIEEPWALCYYRNKLFISHLGSSSLRNFVTVVRLL